MNILSYKLIHQLSSALIGVLMFYITARKSLAFKHRVNCFRIEVETNCHSRTKSWILVRAQASLKGFPNREIFLVAMMGGSV